jgi:hypothetical protein
MHALVAARHPVMHSHTTIRKVCCQVAVAVTYSHMTVRWLLHMWGCVSAASAAAHTHPRTRVRHHGDWTLLGTCFGYAMLRYAVLRSWDRVDLL